MPKKKMKKSKKIKDLFLDRPTLHGGWPSGHSGSWNDKTPVNVKIKNWLESMGLLDDVDHGVLSEEYVRHIIRKLLIETNN